MLSKRYILDWCCKARNRAGSDHEEVCLRIVPLARRDENQLIGHLSACMLDGKAGERREAVPERQFGSLPQLKGIAIDNDT